MSASGGGQILKPEDETDVEVRREDQDNINLFGRLNARLHEVRDERKVLKVRVFRVEKLCAFFQIGVCLLTFHLVL